MSAASRIALLAVFAGLVGLAPVAAAPAAPDDEEPAAWLELSFDARGNASGSLSVGSPGQHGAEIAAAAGRLFAGKSVRVDAVEDDEEYWEADLSCTGALPRTALRVAGQMDVAPLAQALHGAGIDTLSLNVKLPKAAVASCTSDQPWSWVPGRRRMHQCYVATAAPPRAVRLSYGFDQASAIRTLAILALLLAVPLPATLLMRRAALRANADPTAVWFSYSKFLGWGGLALFGGWLIAVNGLRAGELLAFLLNVRSEAARMAGDIALDIGPPLVLSGAAKVLSHPVFARVRGMEWSQRDLALQALWTTLAILVPITCLLGAMGAVTDGSGRQAAGLFVAAVFGFLFSVRALGRRTGTGAEALMVGELRDRVFALAEKAGVKVQQVYVLPAARSRLLNAYAATGNRVLLTDYLLQKLSKREVDAIIGHELAHLRRRHPFLLFALILPVTVLATELTTRGGRAVHADTLLQFLPLPVFIVFFCLLLFSRRFERTADAQAIALTGDPEALITGLARLTRLNLMPLQWGKWDERLLTHPSTLRRAQSIARLAGISDERLAEILSAPEENVEHYTLPPAVANPEAIFSTAFRRDTLFRYSWLLIGTTILAPAVITSAVRILGLEGPVSWVLHLAGVPLAIGACLFAAGRLALWGSAGLERKLRARLQAEGIDPAELGGRFCSFAPDGLPRVYEGFTNWDIGFLCLAGDHLCYLGEQTRFCVRRDQVMEVRVGPGFPGWRRHVTLYVTWRADADGAERTFNVRPFDVVSTWQQRGATRALAKAVEAWRQSAAPGFLPAPLAGVGEPEEMRVTSASPKSTLRLRALPSTFLMVTLLALSAAALLGLPFDVEAGGNGIYVLLVTWLCLLVQWWPFVIYREPRGKGRTGEGVKG